MLPTGVVTFLFTDIEGSTRLFQQHPDAMPAALARHHAILHEAITAANGHVFQVIGDAFCAAFARPDDAVAAALAVQRRLLAEPWGVTGPLRVRIGLHTGPAEASRDDYQSGITLIRVQRFMSAGHGDQTLLSPATANLVRDALPLGASLRDLGPRRLRGLAQPERIFQLIAPDLPAEFPPLRLTEAAESQAEARTPLDQLERGRLVGRSAEFRLLQQHWSLAQQGRGHLVLVSGEPGVGKTRLAQEILAFAQTTGAIILRGGCYEYEATTPYLPFVEALRDWVHLQSAGALRDQLGPTASEIAKLAPEVESKIGPLAPNPPLGSNEERLRLFDNVARLIQRLAAANGLVFCIDDLHWADQGTLSLLHYLLRRLRNDRVLFLACYREIELDRSHPLAAALVDWNREHLATRVALGRLSRADTGTLLATLFQQENISDEFIGAMYRETEGNPFFVEEVVKALIEQGQIYQEDGRWQRKDLPELTIPQSVKEAIGRRLNRLSPSCLDVLHTAAALGKQFRFDELTAVSGLDEEVALDALDAACAAQLLRLGGDDVFAFTHDKIREVLYEEMNVIRRRRLHRRIGEGLEKLYAPTLEAHAHDLSYHFVQSGDLEKSFHYSMQATVNARRLFAHDEALGFLHHAREAAEESEQTERVAAVDAEMGALYHARGLTQLAASALERALAGATSPTQRIRLKTLIGEVYTYVGDPAALPYLHQAMAEIDAQAQPNEMALILAHLGRFHHFRAEHMQSIAYLERARQLAEPLDRPHTLLNIYAYLSGAYQHMAQHAESDRWARVCIALGERKNNSQAIAIGYEFLAENAFFLGYWQHALDYAAQARTIGERIGALDRVAWARFSITSALGAQGHLPEAEAEARAVLEMCEQIGEGRLATWAEPWIAIVAARRGDDATAREFGERGRRRAKELGQMVLRAWSLHAVGYAHLLREEWQQASACYDEVMALWRNSENRIAFLFSAAPIAETYLAVGRMEEASSIISEYLALADADNAPHYQGLGHRVRGQILTAQGAWADAEAEFNAAFTIQEQWQSHLEVAWTLYHRAQMWRQRQDFARARADAERARTLFIECGAVRAADSAASLLARSHSSM